MPNKFFTVQVTSKGKDPMDFIRDIQASFYPELQERLVELADKTVLYMRNIIQSSKKRPSFGSNLENNIEAEVLNSTGGVEIGIGNITRLLYNAPYFEVLNSGYLHNSSTPYIPYMTTNGAPVGSFAPGEGRPNEASFRDGNWERAGQGFFMKPKRPIEGIGYIDKAAHWLKDQIEQETKDWINQKLSNLTK